MAISNNIAVIYVPCGSAEEATNLARTLLEERLIACANMHETRSIYRWKGEMADEPEQVLICKTTKSLYPDVARRIEQLHSYDVPCILQIQHAQTNEAYADWVENEVDER